ncbi:MAG: EF-P beta-lysylation protein EpmB [Thermoanaerobaculales bacterium]
MRNGSAAPWPAGAWRKLLADAVCDVDELLSLVGLETRCLGDDAEAVLSARRFALRVPRCFVARMRPGDPGDPLLGQVLPVDLEARPLPGFTIDPVGELRRPPVDGVLHKYRGRALVVVTGACAIHCRYCFRRHFPYSELGAGGNWEVAIGRVAADPEISEVILSGGDPLTIPDPSLGQLAGALAAVPHVRRLRIHTRLPIVLPQRVDEELLAWMGDLGVPTVVVIHANHANEVDADVRRALSALAATGATLLNQAVLLRGVNDTVDALADLSEVLFDAGVLPYYLHMLDPVDGAGHFAVPENDARRLHAELTSQLPGYLVPRMVREVEGAPAKVGV